MRLSLCSSTTGIRMFLLLFMFTLWTPSLGWLYSQTLKTASTRSCKSKTDDAESSHHRYHPVFRQRRPPPYLAVITEPDACGSDENVRRTYDALAEAVSGGQVNLISIRQAVPTDGDDRVLREVGDRLVGLAHRLWELASRHHFDLVISSDWMDLIMQENVPLHGIHFKESHRTRIPEMRRRCGGDALVVGTSAHSVESAVEAWNVYQPDYFFVGTCYVTQTHPEKSSQRDLEGPLLPGQVARALKNTLRNVSDDSSGAAVPPPVLAIGGIHVHNCHEPVRVYGADGVATIRAVLQAADPAQTVRDMKQNMVTQRA